MIRFLLKERIAEKEFREKRRITFDEIASDIGVSRNTLSRIANSFDYNTTTDVLDKLCNYFDCSIAEIIEHIKE